VDLLDPLYWTILERGIVGIRDASDQGDLSRCRAEAEHIHNILSLIGEPDIHRHLHYATHERETYVEWVLSTDRKELRNHARLAFGRVWQQMDVVLAITAQGWQQGLEEKESE
jgi:hypothetical protein